MGQVVRLRPPFPTALERKLLDLPYDDEADFAIPSFDEMNPFYRSRAVSPRHPRDEADAIPSPLRRPHTFIDCTEGFKDALAVICIIVTFFVVMVMLP